MNVAFHLDNSGIHEVDLRDPLRGNPGIGGTEYLSVAVPFAIRAALAASSLDDPARHRIALLAPYGDGLPEGMEVIQCARPVDAPGICRREGFDLLVSRSYTHLESFKDLLAALEQSEVPCVLWSHNMSPPAIHELVASSECIRGLVHVGREVLDYHRDLASVYKASCIYNSVPVEQMCPKDIYGDSHDVVFLGSLTRAKGFHRLARIWPEVLRRHPEARLHVIGSGGVYDRGVQLGARGLAEASYEEEFLAPLRGEDGILDASVTFHGAMGMEKEPLMRGAAVGVVNPTGVSETFCLSAVEFEALGVPVVSAAEWGLLDTVEHGKTGLLCRKDEEFVDAIVRLLESPSLQEEMGRNGARFVRERFGFEQAAKAWISLFDELERGVRRSVVPPKDNLGYRGKWIKEGLRIAKSWLPPLRTQGAVESTPPGRVILRQVRLLVSPRRWIRGLALARQFTV